MPRERRKVPLYQQGRQQVAGVRARLKPGDSAAGASAVWLISADSLGGLALRAGDRCRGTDGVWWVVKEVSPVDGGEYPCACERESSRE